MANSKQFLDPASGGSEDWAKGRIGIKYSYLFELRPEEKVYDGFLLAENQVIHSKLFLKNYLNKNNDEILRSFQQQEKHLKQLK